MYDYYRDEKCLLCLMDNGKIYYIIVQREPELKHTGKSVITRILLNKHKFIGDFYATQSYFMVKYIDDNYIKYDDMYKGSDRNEITTEELYRYLNGDEYNYMYVYDVSTDTLTIKTPDTGCFVIDFHETDRVEEILDRI